MNLKRVFEGTISVEDYRLEDLPKMATIHANSFQYNWSVDEIAGLLSKQGVHALLLRRRNLVGRFELMGFVIYRIAADEAEILTIVIDNRQRRKGYGRKLVEEVVRHLYRERVGSLFLEVNSQNKAAVDLYRKLEFEEVAQRKGYYANGDGAKTALVMRYNLRLPNRKSSKQ